MPKHIPEYLKLHKEEPLPAAGPPAAGDDLTSVEMLCCAFERCTGWHLQYEPAGTTTARGASAAANGAGLLLSPARRGDDERFARLPRAEAEHLATAIAIVLGELERTRRELHRREAELAAGVPVTICANEAEHLADRLESALSAAVDAVSAQAAALYLLDEGTSELKLRSCFGLPQDRLLDPARPLRGSIADLEALLGHAVVIEDTTLLPHWRCPEDFPAAVCVPVSSSSSPLGTLWIFSAVPRDFTPAQTNLIEIVAGRVASDLEREMLVTAGAQSKSLERDLEEAALWQQEHLPSIAPLIDDWDVAGITQSAGDLASEFFDWSVLADGNLAVAVGDAHGRSVTAGLSAAALHTALKSHAAYRHDAKQMLERINETLWTCSPGGQHASLFYGLVAPEIGELSFATAGCMNALLVQPEGHLSLTGAAPPLGSDAEMLLVPRRQLILPGTALVVVSDGGLSTRDSQGNTWNEVKLADIARRLLHLPAAELTARLLQALGCASDRDRTLLVVKRLR